MDFLVELVRRVCDAPMSMPEPKVYQKLLDYNTALLKGVQKGLQQASATLLEVKGKQSLETESDKPPGETKSKTSRNRISLPLGIFTPGRLRRLKAGTRSFTDLSEPVDEKADPLQGISSASSTHISKREPGLRLRKGRDEAVSSRENSDDAFQFRLPTDDFTLGTVGEYTAIATTVSAKSKDHGSAGGTAEGSPAKGRDDHILSKHRIEGGCTLAQLLVVLGRALLHAVSHKLALTSIPIGHTLMSATPSTLNAIINGSFENHSWDRTTKQLTSSILELRRQTDTSKQSTGRHFQHLNSEFSCDQSLDMDIALAAWMASFSSVAVYMLRMKGRFFSNLWVSPLQRQLQMFMELAPHLNDIRCTDATLEDTADNDTDTVDTADSATDSFGDNAKSKTVNKLQRDDSNTTQSDPGTSASISHNRSTSSENNIGHSTTGNDNFPLDKSGKKPRERSLTGPSRPDHGKLTPPRRTNTPSHMVTHTLAPSNMHTRHKKQSSQGSGSNRKPSQLFFSLPSARTSSADLPGVALDSDSEKVYMIAQPSLYSLSNESFLSLPAQGKFLKRWAKGMATSNKSQAIVESGGESRSFVSAQGNTARALSHGYITPTPLSYSSIHGPNYGTPRRNSVSVSLLSPNPASPPTFMFSSGVETAERTITSISSSALPLYRKEVWLNVSETSPPMQHRKS